MAQNVTVETTISLKALVDEESNKVISVEADNYLVDVLFSFMTIPMGKLVKLARDHSTPLEIGCMNKLYQSVKDLNEQHFRSEECKEIILLPRSVADPLYKKLKLKINDNAEPIQNLLKCSSDHDWLSYHIPTPCPVHGCGSWMKEDFTFSVDDSEVGEVFVKKDTRVIFTDDLQVIGPQSDDQDSSSFLSKLGDKDRNTIKERIFCIGDDQVLNLLLSSLVSKTPFTDTLLKNNPVPEFSSEGKCIALQNPEGFIDEEQETISIKLVASKSKNIVCYAEVREDFVNLLFSFLTLPLGFILKQKLDFPWKGCIDQLCKVVLDFKDELFKSNDHKELLCSPKLLPYPCFSHANTLMGIEKAWCFYDRTMDKVKLRNPEAHEVKHNSGDGSLKGPKEFMVTDDLNVQLISEGDKIEFLNALKVSKTDTEDIEVRVGKKKALSLLVSSFVSDSVLTKAFYRNEQSFQSSRRN